MEENWRTIEGFENYEVSDLGRVRKKQKNHYRYQKLTARDKDGYVRASLYSKNKRYQKSVHRIVAEAFIINEDNKPVVNHKNGIRDDNRLVNLEWCTISENTRHSFDVLGRVGYHNGTKKNVKLIYGCEEDMAFESQRECADYLCISPRSLSNIILKKDGRGIDKVGRKYTIVRDCEGVTTSESIAQ